MPQPAVRRHGDLVDAHGLATHTDSETTRPTMTTKPAVGGAERFAGLWRRNVASPPSPDAAVVYADLAERYSAPFRKFHTMGHIDDCLRQFDEVAPHLVDRDAVEFGLWFHDAVYETGATTNELRSAELFLEQTEGSAFLFRHRVCGLILATRHKRLVRGNDQRFIVDIDLSGFGAPWDEFMRSGELLRQESDQTEEQYQTSQVTFLGRLQKRRYVFLTDYFRDRYEDVARENLRRILADLAEKGYVAA